MSKHTPGPWHIGGKAVFRPTFTIFHKPFGLGDVAEVYEDADARLIAAAPELLEASKEMLQLIDAICRVEGATVRKARAAIAKAKGEPA